MSGATFIWGPTRAWQRNTHVFFRRTFDLDREPGSARVSLFAHTPYHLRVNGVTMGVGPARSYPEHPEYDTYEIGPFLRKGANVVAVRAAHMGYPTFHHQPVDGCFAGWGRIPEAGIDLATDRDWTCLVSEGYDAWTERFSFAVGATDICDLRRDPAGWDMPGCCEGAWQAPLVLSAAPVGELRPRAIPHLTNEECLPQLLLGAHAHDQGEEIVSFKLFESRPGSGDRKSAATGFGHTYIYSPKAQRLTAGTWWGEHFLNGQPLAQARERPEQFARNDVQLDLQQGWNFFFVSYGMDMASWTFHLAVPAGCGLVFSPERDQESQTQFKIAGPVPREAAQAMLAAGAPEAPDACADLAALWVPAARCDLPASPQRGLAWALFGPDQGRPRAQVTDLQVEVGADTSFIFDMGCMRLGRVFVEWEGPDGAAVDFAHAERLKLGRPHHYLNVKVNSGERGIGRAGANRFETTHARGFRYLQVAVRNASAPVILKRVGVVSQLYPYAQEGRFECSDPALNTLWDFGWTTCRLCSEDVITDTPWRERTLYGGDLLPEAATTAVGSSDLRLVRRCVEIFLQSFNPETRTMQSRAPEARHENPLAEYPLIVLLIADWLCRLRDDRELARRAYPIYGAILAKLEEARAPDGLVNVEQVFIAHSYRRMNGRVAAFNALLCAVYEAWAGICERCGKVEEAAAARTQARASADRVNASFWDEERGSYADALDAQGEKVWAPGVYANAWALMFGRPGPERAAAAVKAMLKGMQGFDPESEAAHVSPYNAFYFLGALYGHGFAGDAERMMRLVYSRMLSSPTGTIWEQSHAGKSLSHAWSTAPNFYLSTRALGVRLGYPEPEGLDRVLIAPESETLSWARGTVPHPLGLVAVHWRIAGEALFLSYSAPAGVEVEVRPMGRLAGLRLVAEREG